MTIWNSKKNEEPSFAVPKLTTELLAALDGRFPDRCPRLTEEDRHIWHAVGQRSVVEFLVEQYKIQQENL